MTAKFDWCKPCETYHWTGYACMPQWYVWQAEDPRDDATQIAGHDAQDAAERWAERDDAKGDYCIVGGSDATVCVAPVAAEGPVLRFRVAGETVPKYYAEQLPEEEKT